MAKDSDTSDEVESKQDRAESVSRMLNDEEPPVTPAPNEVAGSKPAEGTEDVGESVSRRGEDMVDRDGKEPGREDVESPGHRPAGRSTDRDQSGVSTTGD
jgi:hypothetical protein